MRRAPQVLRSVLSDQVKEYLLTAILSGDFAPGSRIVETRVARELGISQAPVREALRDLEALGVIEITAFQGARVRQPTKDELLEAYAVRDELESLGVRLALPRLSDADLEALRRDLDAMRRAARNHDRRDEAAIDTRFHARLIAIAGNSTLERVWRYLEPTSRTHITLFLPGVDPIEIAELHAPILAALIDRDEPRAVAAIHRHFGIARSLFESLFPSGDDAGRVLHAARRGGAGVVATGTAPTPAPAEAVAEAVVAAIPAAIRGARRRQPRATSRKRHPTDRGHGSVAAVRAR